MAESSEAECLLRTGALYTRRLGLRSESGDLIFVGVKRGAFSIYFGDEPIYHFDLDGRWQRAFLRGDHYRKALDQTVVVIERNREGVNMTLDRARLSRTQIDELDETIRNVAIDLSVAVSRGDLTPVDPPSADQTMDLAGFHDLMDRVASWDAAAWFSRREQFVKLYGDRMPFVPLDSQNPMVFDPIDVRSGELRSPEDFSRYVRDIAKFLGRRAIQAGTIYLAGDAAIRRPVPEILASLGAIEEVFPLRTEARPMRPQDQSQDMPSISGFEVMVNLGIGAEGLPDQERWRELARARVKRVTALCSGPLPSNQAIPTLSDVKAAAISVSVVLPYGWTDPTIAETLADGINAVPLGRSDFIYLADPALMPVLTDVDSAAVRSPDPETQRAAIEERLAPSRSRGVKVLAYNPAKQWV